MTQETPRVWRPHPRGVVPAWMYRQGLPVDNVTRELDRCVGRLAAKVADLERRLDEAEWSRGQTKGGSAYDRPAAVRWRLGPGV